MYKIKNLIDWFVARSDRDKVLLTILVSAIFICSFTYLGCRMLTLDCRRELQAKDKELADQKTLSEAREANLKRECKEEVDYYKKGWENCRIENAEMVKENIDKMSKDLSELKTLNRQYEENLLNNAKK